MQHYGYHAAAANTERRTDLRLVMVIALVFAVAGLLNTNTIVACVRFAARQRHQYYQVD
tara:strand:+ start:68 stop:244 length:177 start_codon:yes stop_codon:yes gene_type:complete